MRIPLVLQRQLPNRDLPYPIAPQEWRFKQSVDYSISFNRAVIDYAARNRELLLYGIYKMGQRSIERGSGDNWTPSPSRLQAAEGKLGTGGGRGGGNPEREAAVWAELHKPELRDPRAYIIPSDQPDFPTAVKFINALREVNVTVQRATRPFEVNKKTYPAGSFVVFTAQAFRPHVLDMFEPQDHPNDFAYPGGPPKRPYDNAGYTLAYQMGVQFDRVLDTYTCPCERVTGMATPAPGTVTNRSAAGFILSPAQNDAFVAVNRLLKGGATVQRLTAPLASGGKTHPAGSFYVTGGSAARTLDDAARALGVSAEGVTTRPGSVERVSAPRIGLWDTYGGSMESGWTRWILEQYEFPHEVVYTPALDAGNLRAKYDVIVLVDGAIQAQGGRGFGGQQRQPPEQFRHMVGRVSQRTVPALKQFLEAGGEIVTIGSSTQLAYMLGLPVTNALVERSPTGEEKVLSADKFYVPGSLLRVAVDSTTTVAAGSGSHVDVMFDNSPVFRLNPDAQAKGVRPIAWFDNASPLRSGWAWGQNYLEGGVAMAEAKVGQGTLYLFGPEILFRAQPHGTFRFFFNALLD
jgi:hypothetical protein